MIDIICWSVSIIINIVLIYKLVKINQEKDVIYIDVGIDFSDRLLSDRQLMDKKEHTAGAFKRKYLNNLDNKAAWRNSRTAVVLDFSKVRVVSPSFAIEAFGYFMQYTNSKAFYKKIKFENISRVKKAIIDIELASWRRE